MPADPTILHERSGVIVLAKPGGLPTQAPAGIASLESWLRARLAPGAYLGIPHRLDRAVSGVILMAVTPRAARQLSRQFERREVAKTYVGIVAAADDRAAIPEGEWRDSIAKVPEAARGTIVDRDDPAGREAVTGVRLLGVVEPRRWLVELRPVTGRMHQLRIQAASRGLPIEGDTLYGGPAPDGDADRRDAPIALHASTITFRDPEAAVPVTVGAPLPAAWPAAARSLLAADGPRDG